MSQKQFYVQLSEYERVRLQKIIRSGKHKARKITRCRILLLADGPNGKTDEEISDALNVCLATIFNIRRRYSQEGLERAIDEGARSGQPPKFKGRAAAKITAIACSTPPDGQAHWSLRLLADRVVELKIVESISHQSVSNILKKTSLNRT
jgi:putative transposase